MFTLCVLHELTHPVGLKATFIWQFRPRWFAVSCDNAKVWHTAGLHQQLDCFIDP